MVLLPFCVFFEEEPVFVIFNVVGMVRSLGTGDCTLPLGYLGGLNSLNRKQESVQHFSNN